MDYAELIGKKVFIKTKTNMQYSGIIKSTDSEKITLSDKYGAIVLISRDDISVIEVK